jgi:uncharacterized protein
MARMSLVTLGARDLPHLRSFYRSWGWVERPGATDDYVAFEAGGVQLALYPLELLSEEAAPGEPAAPESWRGVTLAVNLGSRDDVDIEYQRALDCGARAIAAPVPRSWGGYSGYVADPEGHRWEIAWAPP